MKEHLSGTAASGAARITEVLRNVGPQTRAELIEATGMSRSTIGSRLDQLQRAGLVGPAGAAYSNGGRPPVRTAWLPRSRSVIAIDLGATHARVAWTDLAGTPHASETVSLDIADGPVSVLDRLVSTAADLRDTIKTGARGPLAGIGIGLPGPVDARAGLP